jgi:hypothetical protein
MGVGRVVCPGRDDVSKPELEGRADGAPGRRSRSDLEEIDAHAATGPIRDRRIERELGGWID